MGIEDVVKIKKDGGVENFETDLCSRKKERKTNFVRGGAAGAGRIVVPK